MESHAPTWLINTFIYLSAAVVAVPLSQAFGLGSIIGYLAAGMAIGPWGLGLVTNVEDILHFAEFGVVLMLFLVGLELEPQRLWSLRKSILGGGTAQVLGCTAALFAVGVLAGAPWRIALVAGMGLALSSTAIALQVMNQRNLMRTASGQAGFSILLFQDIAAIPILALLPLLGQTLESNGAQAQVEPAWEAIKIIAVIGGIMLGGRIAIRPVFRFIARSRAPEIFTAASLLLVVGIAGLMQLVGLSMALGAFLAGVLLAESEYRRELETNIEPFKGLLLGLFFIAVGMGIDFGVLAEFPMRMLAIVAGFLIVKAIVIFAIARVIALPFQERPVFTLLLAQGGEFAFVVFQAAEGAHVFSSQTSSLLVGSVAVSMLVSPLILVAMDRWLLPRYARCGVPVLDEISEQQDAPVIIAGMGRYGQIIARVLIAQGYPCTVLDHDAEMIETARRVGYRVFYGDATRLDLLRTAGIAKAKLLVVAVDNVEQSLKVVDVARAHYPDLPLVARARDVTHWNQLRDRGVMLVQREMFESSLASARSVLEILGQTPEATLQTINRFRQHNLDLLEQLHPHYKDSAKLMSVIKQGRRQFEEQMARERQELAQSPTPHASLDHLPGAEVGNAGGGGVLGGGTLERASGGGGAA